LGETFYIAESHVYDLVSLEDLIQDALGTWAVRVRIPRLLLMGIARAAETAGRIGRFTPRLNRHKARDFLQTNWSCSVAKAERLLEYKSRIPFAQGARQTVEWYRAHGWL
jgi:nucleoside-diphosphate-sugar epimerase